MTRIIKTLIVDDERLAREYLHSLLESQPDIEILDECRDGLEAVKSINNNNPDLVFLDVQMPGMTGTQVIEEIGLDNMPLVVFVTAYDQYAIEAFEMHALDYLLKPFDEERFGATLERARTIINQKDLNDHHNRMKELLSTYNEISEKIKKELKSSTVNFTKQEIGSDKDEIKRIPVKTGSRVKFIDVDQLYWIEAADYCVNLHTEQSTHLLRESLQNLETKLNPAKFFRIHRQAIVNLDYIKELKQIHGSEYHVILKNNIRLKLSRRRKEDLEKLLGRSF